MTFHLPEYIDECVDASTDPLVTLLMREGAMEEAYTLQQQHTADAQQIVERCIIEQRPHEEEDSTAYELPLEQLLSQARAKAKAKRNSRH